MHDREAALRVPEPEAAVRLPRRALVAEDRRRRDRPPYPLRSLRDGGGGAGASAAEWLAGQNADLLTDMNGDAPEMRPEWFSKGARIAERLAREIWRLGDVVPAFWIPLAPEPLKIRALRLVLRPLIAVVPGRNLSDCRYSAR